MPSIDIAGALVKLVLGVLPFALAYFAGGSAQRSADAKANNEVKDAQLKASLDRPADRAALADCLRQGHF